MTWLIALGIASVVIVTVALVMTVVNLSIYSPVDRSERRAEDVAVDRPELSVCVPARNEEPNLRACVESILGSAGDLAIEVLVYDDQSTDATPRILDELIASDPRVRRVDTVPLPEGWIGKQHACWRMSEAAKGGWMLFTDADVRFSPGSFESALAAAQRYDAELISTFPRELTGSVGEAIIIPMIHFVLFSYLPMAMMRMSNSASASAGCGQFVLISRTAYDATGGHSSARHSMHEGILLPRLVRRAGMHTDLFDGTDQVQCRMYHGWRQTWAGFTKNAYEGLGSPVLLVVFTLLHAIGHVWPWFVLLGAIVSTELRGIPLYLAGLAIVIALLQRTILGARFRQSFLGVALHPIGVIAMTTIQWHSFALSVLGRRSWRGRGFDGPAQGETQPAA